METTIHMAGPRVEIAGRIIQRCQLCGLLLCDSLNVMLQAGQSFQTWPPDALVDRDASGSAIRWELIAEGPHLAITDEMMARLCLTPENPHGEQPTAGGPVEAVERQLLFSERRRIADDAVAWLEKSSRAASRDPVNIVTALQALGYLRPTVYLQTTPTDRPDGWPAMQYQQGVECSGVELDERPVHELPADINDQDALETMMQAESLTLGTDKLVRVQAVRVEGRPNHWQLETEYHQDELLPPVPGGPEPC